MDWIGISLRRSHEIKWNFYAYRHFRHLLFETQKGWIEEREKKVRSNPTKSKYNGVCVFLILFAVAIMNDEWVYARETIWIQKRYSIWISVCVHYLLQYVFYFDCVCAQWRKPRKKPSDYSWFLLIRKSTSCCSGKQWNPFYLLRCVLAAAASAAVCVCCISVVFSFGMLLLVLQINSIIIILTILKYYYKIWSLTHVQTRTHTQSTNSSNFFWFTCQPVLRSQPSQNITYNTSLTKVLFGF